MVVVTAGLARSPGSEIWLLQMPRRFLRLVVAAEGPGHPMIISGTELERFISLRAFSSRVAVRGRNESHDVFRGDALEKIAVVEKGDNTQLHVDSHIWYLEYDQLWRKHRLNANGRQCYEFCTT